VLISRYRSPSYSQLIFTGFLAHIHAYPVTLSIELNKQTLAAMYSISFLSRAIKKRAKNCSLTGFFMSHARPLFIQNIDKSLNVTLIIVNISWW